MTLQPNHTFILLSIEERFAMVHGGALACRFPVVESYNTGGRILFEDRKKNFIVPFRLPDLIAVRLQELAHSRAKCDAMSAAATERLKSMSGWSVYGDQIWEQIRPLAEVPAS